MSHINGTFRNQAKNTDNQLYEIEEKLRYLEDSSRRNNLRIEESNLGSMQGKSK